MKALLHLLPMMAMAVGTEAAATPPGPLAKGAPKSAYWPVLPQPDGPPQPCVSNSIVFVHPTHLLSVLNLQVQGLLITTLHTARVRLSQRSPSMLKQRYRQLQHALGR